MVSPPGLRPNPAAAFKAFLPNKNTIYKDGQKGSSPHINEITYHMYTQMKYEEYYAEIDQKTDEFLNKWGDIYLYLVTISLYWNCTY